MLACLTIDYTPAYAKTFLILYPQLENSKTCIAIMNMEKNIAVWVVNKIFLVFFFFCLWDFLLVVKAYLSLVM